MRSDSTKFYEHNKLHKSTETGAFIHSFIPSNLLLRVTNPAVFRRTEETKNSEENHTDMWKLCIDSNLSSGTNQTFYAQKTEHFNGQLL